jgi:hypothetical protein
VRFDAEGFFYSDLDHARYQRVYEALVDHGRSVALLSPLSVPVEHYGKRLLAALRRRSDVILETYTPGGAEALIERMNKLLEPFSLEEARGSAGEGTGPLHVMVLHELDGLEDDEAMLLARLAQDLPGVRVALLFLGYRRARLPEVLERSFSSSLRCWNIPVLEEDALLALEGDAEQLGVAEEVLPALTALRREVVLQALAAASEPPEAEDRPGPAAGEALEGQERPPEPSGSSGRATALKPLPLVRWPFLLAGGAVLLVMSLWFGGGAGDSAPAPEASPASSSALEMPTE